MRRISICALAGVMALAHAAEALAAEIPPIPRPRPDTLTPADIVAGAGSALPAAASSFAPTTALFTRPAGPQVPGLASALDAALAGDLGRATAAQSRMDDPVAKTLVEWALIRSGAISHDHNRIALFLEDNAHWPGAALARRRMEQAVARAGVGPDGVLAYFGRNAPGRVEGRIAIADAYAAKGEADKAAPFARAAWQSDDMSESREQRFLARHSAHLRPQDHRYRMMRLLFDGEYNAALRVADRLPAADKAAARAFRAAMRGASDADSLLAAVPRAWRAHPAYQFANVTRLRRDDRTNAAVNALLAADGGSEFRLVGGESWYLERAILARRLIERGDYVRAYRLMAEHEATGGEERASAEFMAGWLALRFLGRPDLAEDHFTRLGEGVSMPISVARGDYWLGRALEAQEREDEARAAYGRAGAHATTYHGQLALARLGHETLELKPRPLPSIAQMSTFGRRDLVRAVRLLQGADKSDMTVQFLVALADHIEDDTELQLLGQLAESIGGARYALIVGKRASYRGKQIETHAFPTNGIPPYTHIGPQVDRAVVYSIARQESEFLPTARSHAGALGLLQLLPGTARATATKYGASYSLARLTGDPAYNAQLGAAHLGELIERYGGSYIMTFAGYNAGPARVRDWVAAFGDPRDPRIDAIDWVELIPFAETRAYVQRIIENVQVYRARLGGGSAPLQIEADLKRGSGES